MKARICIVLFLVLVASSRVPAQISPFSLGIWHHQSLTGELGVRGTYRGLNSLIDDLNEVQRSLYATGGLKLNSKSYFVRPDILQLGLNGEFYPETRAEKYILLPDRSEVRTLNKLGIDVTVCDGKPLSLSSFVNFDNSYFRRENLTDVKNNSRQWGGRLTFSNKVLPISLSFRKGNWRQEELQTDRIYFMDQTNIQARASKSFHRNDRHSLSYQHNDYYYRQTGFYEVQNTLDRAVLENSVYFDATRNYNFNTRFAYNDQTGYYAFRRFEGAGRLDFKLPHNFRFNAAGEYFDLHDEHQDQSQMRFRAEVNHRLYESLDSRLFAEYYQTEHSAFEESNLRLGGGLNYTKKMGRGRLNLGYRYARHNQVNRSDASNVTVFNEEHALTDGEIILLDRPYVILETVVVKDATGAILYQLGMDYILIERNNFVEIQRVLGGQISNDQAVLVDYQMVQPGDYDYGMDNHYFSAGLLLFGRLVEIYYRGSVQKYPLLHQTDFLTLNHYTQNAAGLRLDVGFARGGIEYDNYNSNIVPYEMIRYFLEVNKRFGSRFLMGVNGNMRDYLVINYVEKQQFANLSSRLACNLRPGTSASLEVGYLLQRGMQRNLDLITSRAEFNTVYRQIYLKVGIELYQRYQPLNKYLINGAYIQVSRKF